MCGKLNYWLYGFRPAAAAWEKHYSQLLESVGFARGVTCGVVFYHEGRDISLSVHGDDFTLLGNEIDLDWFRSKIVAKFEVKMRGRLGPCPQYDKSIRILHRVVEWTESGITYEPDQRHAEIIVRDLGLLGNSKAVVTPGEKVAGDPEKEEELLYQKREKTRAVGDIQRN